ncbi:hypothetical protein PspLS_05752 [Pyricularia sp. CBS 133598]|nr:hypothetical protein PspLS_05752 [Pyricularia sp. CBS 133598]
MSEDNEVKTSAEGAQAFVDGYYKSCSERRQLASYYINSCAHYRGANMQADISINGMVLEDPTKFEELLEKQANGGRVKYDVEGFDAHVLNANFVVAMPENLRPAQQAGRTSRDRADRDHKISIMVMVNGAVQFGADRSAPRRPFTEVFVLVPNWDSMGPKAQRGAKRFLILSQNYRAM